ncbi:MAG: magnesium chelatase [Phycisphaerales bacterium]|nr:MAG: magnesium chelatase [Phycisphaerales bacterium]
MGTAPAEAISKLRDAIASVFMGNQRAVDRVLRTMLAGGHLLIEDVPGVGKTVLAGAIARSVRGRLARIQMTPDLLPSDVLGVSVYDRDQGQFVFKPGPIFANFVLADEINRTTPRTQTALLEAMSEGTVSIDGVSHPLPRPFMVIATQNPYDFEGTYLLPENQLDRFLMRTRLGYPDPETEVRVLESRPASTALPSLQPVMDPETLVQLQRRTDQVRVDERLLQYVVAIARATRSSPDLRLGLSPRGALALTQAARATALIDGRDYVVPEDVLDNVLPVVAHRLILRGQIDQGDGREAEAILESIVQSVDVPT